MNLKRVVVTGLGALTPLGNTVEEYWTGLVNGVSGAGPITKFDAAKFKTRFACEVKNFNVNNYMDRKEARRLDPFAQYAMVTAEEAFQDSGIDLEKIDLRKAGVIWGSGIGGLQSFETEVKEYTERGFTPRFNPFFIPKMIADIAAGHISIKYGFRGANYATVSACASATHAISAAADYIRLGKANVMITGGSEASVAAAGVGGFSALKALSERNDSPETASRPFDKDRDGFVLGEGAGALILEEYEHAKARGAKIYCELAGSGASADAYHMTAPHPEGLGATEVMQYALEDAGMKAEEIDYINVHGTSTPLGDVAELKAVEKAFGEHAYELNISSTKSMTGHLLGAAGAIEAIACVKALESQTVPPTINHFTDDEEINPRLKLTFNTAQKREIKAALSNTFGFGGHNSSVIFRVIEE
ncbi:beta-ketoacyl-ACP synthase II [Aureibacter tunicatorum]|uniref:3-oxoacyl-[acyl-carrier-protein] synthase 2 n=1 Tax=Aureibacter tunicatorum TaxID=866807 RepID=A0AAE3XPQ4_9BACT|nr:beta-ketoacyl-ACP synthase II [Aureibacter tunicatorum]MDR6240872.1 3-oxoacyl-[acyl-carrier-protein] synthase II [Aureibacter tunicatorum]BDD03652.1 3-oxoacyl-[acyl-carrier-protein] synthase 2 [Aureibacter tunicatorum]